MGSARRFPVPLRNTGNRGGHRPHNRSRDCGDSPHLSKPFPDSDSTYLSGPHSSFHKEYSVLLSIIVLSLPAKVTTKIEDNLVTYTIKDSDISFMTTRKLVREDKDAPELKLNGNDHIYVTVNTNYNEQGATATDKCDGDLSDKAYHYGYNGKEWDSTFLP